VRNVKVKETNMRPLFFTILITLLPFIANASGTIQVSDTLDLFENITDISRQIQQQAATADKQQVLMNDTSVPVLKDTVQAVKLRGKPAVSFLSDSLSLIRRNPLDSLYQRGENGTLKIPPYNYNSNTLRGLTFLDTLFYNPLFLPMIYNGRILPRNLTFYYPDDDYKKGLLIPLEQTFSQKLERSDFIQNVRLNFYSNYCDRIKYSVRSFDSLPTSEADDDIVRKTYNPFRELLQTQTGYSLDAPGVEGATIDRKYWVRSGEHSFQFSQNYFSENWHKGGTNNLNFNSLHILKANYKKEKIKFNNTLEWRLSVFNAPDDSLRQYRIGNDLLRYYGDFGLDAFIKGWSYSMNLEAKSQLFKSYPTNSNELRSAFIAPLYVNAGVGLKFNLDNKSKKVRDRRVRWELALAPISINYRYVGNESVDVVRYGIPEGKKSILDLGTTITSILKYDFTRYITWDSRLTYFTSYDKVISDIENSLNLSLSNALSTRIYLNVRFDDGVPAHQDLKHWQINQTLSFGLNYKW